MTKKENSYLASNVMTYYSTEKVRGESLEIEDTTKIIVGVLSFGILAGIVTKVMRKWMGSPNW